jgi:hypothetical protein
MTSWETWSTALIDGTTSTVNALVADGIATTALHYDAFLESPPSAPWSDKTLAIYACGPPVAPALLGKRLDTASSESVLSDNQGVLATRGALWFYHRLLSDPKLLTRISLIHPLSNVRPCPHGGFNEVDPDYVPWLVHLVSEHSWRPDTAVHLMLLQLWQSDGAWSDDLRARRDMFPEPPLLVLYFLFYFRSVLPHAEKSLRSWLGEATQRMSVEPAFLYDLLAWDPNVQSLALDPYDRTYCQVLLGHPVYVKGYMWTADQWAELLYLSTPGAESELGVPPLSDSTALWLQTQLASDISDETKQALVVAAPTDVLETLLASGTELAWVSVGYQGRGTPVDDRVLVLLDAFGEPNSQDWYDDIAARWRGSASGLQKFLSHARASGRLPAVWWTAVAYNDTVWQDEILSMSPVQTTCDDLMMRLGPDTVKESLERWAGMASRTAIQASVNAWMV